ncbi:MAG TPA: FAD-binding oxidoreductase, partial [Ramlibacter sp.]|nr:FAD-binding oxidoreductase [Ramlibacter sp.]
MSESVLRDLRAWFPARDAPLCAPEDLGRYEQGARYGSGRALCVMRPRTTEQVQRVMQVCARHRCRLVVQGANTGMTAASSPDASGSQVLLSLERFKAPLEIDAAARVARVGAGVLLSELNAAAAPHGLFFPIDLSADPCMGGMVATNTGGTRLMRYGDVRQNLLWLKAVLADEHATLLDAANLVQKNNTGLDAKQLFVGTASSFGVVTELMVRLAP